MKALVFNQTGNPAKVLALEDMAKPVPAADEVLIRILASPVNPSDNFFIQGTYRLKPAFPQIAGLEGAGIIEAVGRHVSLPIGALVAFDHPGAWSEYVTVPATSVIVLPEDFPVEKAALFYLNPFTAWGLLDQAQVRPGDWLLLTAAHSFVSKIVLQLARLRNIKVIGVVRKSGQSEELKRLGATAILSQEDNIPESVMEITSGQGVQAALDAVGGDLGTQVLQSLKPEGRLIVYGLFSERPVAYHNRLIIYKNLSIQGFGIRGYLQGQSEQQRTEMISSLIEIIGKPSFLLPVQEGFSMKRFGEALRAEAQNGRSGKIIFRHSLE